jgi:hypothetical protein
MRSRFQSLRTRALAVALLGALAGTLAVVVPGLAGSPSQSGTQRSGGHASPQARASAARRGPRGRRGRTGRRGPAGPTGPAATNVVRPFTVNWRSGAYGGRDSSSTSIPAIGTLTAVCNPGQQQIVIDPATPNGANRTVATVTSFQGEGTAAASNDRLPHDPGTSRIVIPLPVNGVLNIVLSVEPQSGDGGAGPPPATVVVSSELKLNDPNPTQNFCFVAGQALQNG